MSKSKKATTKSFLKDRSKKSLFFRVLGVVLSPFRRIARWKKSLQPRSPHRSFRRTFRRDYERPLNMPGYIGFTREVWQTLYGYRRIFGPLIVVYAVLSGLLVGIASQSIYTQLSDLLRTTGDEIFEGSMGKVSEAGLLLLTGLTGGINPAMTEAQQLISGFLVLMMWLTTVWLLRALLAGHRPGVKDGFYNAGAPLIPTLLLGLLLILQLVPAGFAAIGASALMPTGLVDQGAESMIFWVVLLLLVVLSLYWVTSTLIAMIIVTLPGMYPLKALKSAHELVIGRRLPIVKRFVWLFAVTAALWAVTLIPIILIDAWLKGIWQSIAGVPVVPLALLFASSASVVWSAGYIYLLYRKVVDDDSSPD